MSKEKIRFLTQFALLLALEAIVCFTPLGSLPAIGPIVATLMMVPAVVAACILGPRAGTAMGAFAGLFSLIVWTFTPPNPAVAFVFSPAHSFGDIHGGWQSLVICVVARALGGAVAGLVHMAVKRAGKHESLAAAFGGALGSIATTFCVMGGIYLFFSVPYAAANGLAVNMLLAAIGMVILTSGIPEAIICAVAAAAVVTPVKKISERAA